MLKNKETIYIICSTSEDKTKETLMFNFNDWYNLLGFWDKNYKKDYGWNREKVLDWYIINKSKIDKEWRKKFIRFYNLSKQ